MLYRAKPVLVFAHKIVKVEDADSSGSRHLELENDLRVVATAAMLSRITPAAGDYFVVQSDGYAYLNPKDVFERKYDPAGEATATGSAPAQSAAPAGTTGA